jgi:hypothetical protein
VPNSFFLIFKIPLWQKEKVFFGEFWQFLEEKKLGFHQFKKYFPPF